MNTGELAVLKKFVKSKRANSLDLLRELSFEGLSLNYNTVLTLFANLKTQYAAISPDNLPKLAKDTSEAAILAARLSEFKDLSERIEVLTFKTFFLEEFEECLQVSKKISMAAKNVSESHSLRQLLHIIVQAINQRLKDFAQVEKLDFTNYKVHGVPMNEVLIFMKQNQVTMEIIAEKILQKGLTQLSGVTIPLLQDAVGISIAERLQQPLRTCRLKFKGIEILTGLGIEDYVAQISKKIVSLETGVSTMESELSSLSQYLGETSNWAKIQSGSESFTILTMVDTFVKRWHEIVKKVSVKKAKNDSNNAKLREMISRTSFKRRESLVYSSDDGGWESDIE